MKKTIFFIFASTLLSLQALAYGDSMEQLVPEYDIASKSGDYVFRPTAGMSQANGHFAQALLGDCTVNLYFAWDGGIGAPYGVMKIKNCKDPKKEINYKHLQFGGGSDYQQWSATLKTDVDGRRINFIVKYDKSSITVVDSLEGRWAMDSHAASFVLTPVSKK